MGSSTDTSEKEFAAIMAKYAAEADKRRRPDGIGQFADIGLSEKFKHFAEDPWIRSKESLAYLSQPVPVANGGHTKVLVTGAGYGALLYAVRLIQTAGFKAEDFVFADSAWGFGGTWYWNRYPGLMCDVESACYLPLLDETGFIPKHRYSYGPELRQYAEQIAKQFDFNTRPLFGSTIKKTVWDEAHSEWVTSLERMLPLQNTTESYIVRSDFVVLASGILNRPKILRIEGLDSYRGHIFHTSRWDYECTGGSPEDPAMDLLRDKKVAFIGTGATGIQVVPQLAEWANHLYVFQRTPSGVDERGQRPIKPEEWQRDITQGKKEWQRERRENMAAFLSHWPDLPATDLVDDGWTHFPAMAALVGSPRAAGLTLENAPNYALLLHKLDLPRQERVRQRVDEVVKDPKTAESLKPWYASWCKRPCFHDDYLHTFNKPNVTLVDTAGKGIDSFSTRGVRFGGNDYDVDLVILGTGFESYTAGSPSFRARIDIVGRKGVSLEEKWDKAPGTLHGVLSNGFPNLLLTGLAQGGTRANVVHIMDILASHTSSIIAEARKKVDDQSKKLIIEPNYEAEEAWSMAVAANAYAYGAISGCTPSYATLEGSRSNVKMLEERIKIARSLGWGRGLLNFQDVLAGWRKGDIHKDIQIAVA